MRLEDLDGVGPKRARKLRDAGIDSVQALSAIEPGQLSQAAGISESVAQSLIVRARNSAQAPARVATWKIVLLIAFVGAALVFGVNWLSTPSTYEYNGFTFTQSQCSQERECWTTLVNLNIGVREVPFYYRPSDVQDVAVDPSAVAAVLNLTRSRGTSLTITFDEGVPGEVGLAASNLAAVTGQRLYNISTSGSVYGSPTTCADANSTHGVVYFMDGDLNGVTTRDGCVLVVAQNPEQLLRVSEAYRMHLLRILP